MRAISERFDRAIARFDFENSQDPNLEKEGNREVPRELLYAQRLTAWVEKLSPGATETLLLAARCQHLCRWKVPRSKYPADRAGYLRWRNDLKRFHAELASGILHECGYDEEVIARVRRLNLKEGFPADAESRTLEDALCLVFLEFQLAEFAARTEHGKVVNALRKSWAKMTENGRNAALGLKFDPVESDLIMEAIRPLSQGAPDHS